MAKKNKLIPEDYDIGDSDIGGLVRKLETNYLTGTTHISKYVDFSLYENTNVIDAYLNSKFTSGLFDSMGREKPFFNISVGARNVWWRATDRDRKNIRVRATTSKQMAAGFAMNLLLQQWMRDADFGSFLNEWGKSLAGFGSSVVTFVVQEGDLNCAVENWNQIIIDSVEFEGNPMIKILQLTEAQLRSNPNYDQEMVDLLCMAREARETTGKQNQDNLNDYIKLYEIHGKLSLKYLTGKRKDQHTYVDQMQVVSFVGVGDKDDEFNDFILTSGREKDPHMITHLIKEDGRSQSIGAVEYLFDAQWMNNHTVKAIKDQLDLASKLIFQTSDGNFLGQNALNAIETGDILIHAVNAPLSKIDNGSHDISSLQSYRAEWKQLGNEITGISEAMLGVTPKSGTAWRQTEAVLNESYGLFNQMKQNKDLHIEQILRRFIIPYLKTKMDTVEELSDIFDAQSIKQIDALYVPKEATKRANKKIIDQALNENFSNLDTDPIEQPNMEAVTSEVQGELDQFGNQRFFLPSEIPTKTWKSIIKDLEWTLEVPSDEDEDMDAIVTTLNTTFKTLAAMQGRPMTDDEKMVFNKILDATAALSPLQLSNKGSPSGGSVEPLPEINALQ